MYKCSGALSASSALSLVRRAAAFALLLLLVLPLFAPASAQAQDEAWSEQATAYFEIVYATGEEGTASAYAGFVDGIYEDIAATFNHQVETPLTLRLYPTFDSYVEVNPVARDMDGVVAHADFRRREVAVIVSQTSVQTPEEIQNNVRHELTHIFASDLSDNQLNTGFQEGIAQYFEMPTPEGDRKMALLNRSFADNDLMNWSDFVSREAIYSAPERSYPQTLSAVTFLVENYGFDQFRTFLINSASSSGYRSALEQTYGVSSTELEARWREWLPTFLDGSHVNNVAANYELSYPRQLLREGRYAEAQAELEQAIDWLATTPQTDLLQEAESLLELSQRGQQAASVATDARAALEAGDYDRTRRLVAEAQATYAEIGDTRQEQVLAVYAARAERGMRANDQLGEASAMAESLRLVEAREQADAAASEFAALGDTSRLNQALDLRQSMDTLQRLAGITLLSVGLLGVLGSLWGRWAAGKPEIW
jgi:hypothetical protein